MVVCVRMIPIGLITGERRYLKELKGLRYVLAGGSVSPRVGFQVPKAHARPILVSLSFSLPVDHDVVSSYCSSVMPAPCPDDSTSETVN